MKIISITVTLLAVLFTTSVVNAQEKKAVKSEKQEVKSDSKAAPATKATPAKKATKAEPATKATPATKAEPATKATPATPATPAKKAAPGAKKEKKEVKANNDKTATEPSKISVSDDGLPAENKKKSSDQ